MIGEEKGGLEFIFFVFLESIWKKSSLCEDLEIFVFGKLLCVRGVVFFFIVEVGVVSYD